MKKNDLNKLSAIITNSGLLEVSEAETLMHALSDISESIEKIYTKIIPAILLNDRDKEKLQDLLWDVREEFRHIEYHINDANLNNL
ncbi:MAG: hypothetical protein K1X28_05995 [Parachlamydiales bacterium]|nr:hypothetical protein [Parachlamydiales bacterium]